MGDLLLAPPAASGRRDLTADEFLRLNVEGPHDLIDGRVVSRRYSSMVKGAVCATIGCVLHARVPRDRWRAFLRVGVVCGTAPDSVIAPDFAVSVRRPIRDGFSTVPPVIAGYVRCPSAMNECFKERVSRLLSVGLREIWILDPDTREAEVFRPDGPMRRVLSDGRFETDELPGFSASLTECFEDLDAE